MLPLDMLIKSLTLSAWTRWRRIICRRKKLVDVDPLIEADVTKPNPVLSELVV